MALKALFPILGVIQIAGLTYTEVPHEDFSHAYALKNIVRLIASAFSAGLISQYWLINVSRCREEALLQCTHISKQMPFASVFGSGTSDHTPITLQVGQEILIVLAFVCVLGAAFVLIQKRLR
jgi:hypothetical protein